jgi:hypothetical protein
MKNNKPRLIPRIDGFVKDDNPLYDPIREITWTRELIIQYTQSRISKNANSDLIRQHIQENDEYYCSSYLQQHPEIFND